MSQDTEKRHQAPTVPISAEDLRDTVNPNRKKSVFERFSRRQQMGVVGLILAIGAGAGIVGAKLAEGTKSDNAPAPNEPTAEAPVTPGEQEPAAIPAEAQSFVDSYGDRYVDPVATYYAEQEYVAEAGGLTSTVDDEWAASYVPTLDITSPESPLHGIGFAHLPLETQINSTTMVEVLNNPEVSGAIDRYMNLIARNTSNEAIAAIDNEFLKYLGRDNANAANLLATLKSVVAQYGSAANYSLAPAVAVDYQTDDAEHTTVITNKLDMPTIDDMSEEGLIRAFHTTVDLRINVESFDESGNRTETSVVPVSMMNLSVERVAPGSPVDPGYISLGQI